MADFGSLPCFERTLMKRTALPHPSPLPLGEGEPFAVSAKDVRRTSPVSSLANLPAHDRCSLSQRERARVRESCATARMGVHFLRCSPTHHGHGRRAPAPFPIPHPFCLAGETV